MKKILLVVIMIIPLVFLNKTQGKSSSKQVFLNHLFLILDTPTYTSIENSEFLQKDFAVFERRTTVQNNMIYTGIYFYGTNTYIEFFDTKKIFLGGSGTSGIAFGVDQTGALNALKAQLPPDLLMSEETVTRLLGEKQIPWFSSLRPNKLMFGSSLWAWIMEYDPRFLEEWHHDLDADNQGIERRRILARYATFLKRNPSQTHFEDVTGITAAVDSTTKTEFTRLCKFLGYSVDTKEGDTTLRGPDIVIHLVPETKSTRGIQKITMRVRSMPEENKRYKFGPGSVLEFHDNGTATWSF